MTDLDKPITARLMSLEFFCSALFTAFLVGGTWFGLTSSVAAQDDAIKSVQQEQKEIGSQVQKIKTDVAVILERQKAADLRAERQEARSQRILDIVQKGLGRNDDR